MYFCPFNVTVDISQRLELKVAPFYRTQSSGLSRLHPPNPSLTSALHYFGLMRHRLSTRPSCWQDSHDVRLGNSSQWNICFASFVPAFERNIRTQYSLLVISEVFRKKIALRKDSLKFFEGTLFTKFRLCHVPLAWNERWNVIDWSPWALLNFKSSSLDHRLPAHSPGVVKIPSSFYKSRFILDVCVWGFCFHLFLSF